VETYTSWRGTTIGPTATFNITAPLGSDFGWEVDVSSRSRMGQTALYEAVMPQPLTRDINIRPGTAAAGSNMDDWRAAAVAFFSPFLGPATLAANFGGDTRTTIAIVSGIKQHPQVAMRSDKEGILQAKLTRFSPYWRSASQSTTSLTVTNDGNAPASPTITIRPTTGTVTRKRVTFQENTGEGLVNHPLQLSVTTDASATAGSNYYVFSGGRPALFQIITPGGASKVYVRLSLPPGGSDFSDIVMGSAVANTITANQLPPWGMDWSSGSTFSNTTWTYLATAGTLNGITAPAVWDILRAPKIPGVWSNTIYTINVSTAWTPSASTVILVGGAAMQVNTQIRAIVADALQGFDTSATLTTPQGGVRYRLRNASEWTAVTPTGTGSGASFHLDPVDVPAAIDIALIAANPNVAATWSTHPTNTPPRILLESADVPTITVGSSVTMRRVNGRLTNTTTGDYVDIEDVYIDDDASGGLVIDTLAGGNEKNWIHPSLTTSPLYTGSGGQGWKFSNPAGLPLVPGANVLAWQGVGTGTGSGDGSPTITTVFHDTWIG
jgi:hypothetical protein